MVESNKLEITFRKKNMAATMTPMIHDDQISFWNVWIVSWMWKILLQDTRIYTFYWTRFNAAAAAASLKDRPMNFALVWPGSIGWLKSFNHFWQTLWQNPYTRCAVCFEGRSQRLSDLWLAPGVSPPPSVSPPQRWGSWPRLSLTTRSEMFGALHSSLCLLRLSQTKRRRPRHWCIHLCFCFRTAKRQILFSWCSCERSGLD